MKKIATGVLSVTIAAISFGGLTVGVAAPASANTGSIGVCQATSSDRNPYNFNTVSIDSIVNSDGTFKQGGINANDIVPKFSYIVTKNGTSTRKYFDGQGTDKERLTAADCPGGPEKVIAQPNEPTYTLPSCKNPELPYGRVTLPKDLGLGVGSATDPALSADNKHISTTYTLASDTKKSFYEWADISGDTKSYTFNTKHISEVGDPLYIVDEKTGVGACELSNTGAGSIKSEHLVIAGGLVFGGALLVAFSARRRKA